MPGFPGKQTQICPKSSGLFEIRVLLVCSLETGALCGDQDNLYNKFQSYYYVSKGC